MQDSAELALKEMEESAAEEVRIAFVYLLIRTFKESGLQVTQAQELGIDRPAFWRATNIDKRSFVMPERETLWRWCRILYVARGRLDREVFDRIVHLAGYQTPAEIQAAQKETSEHYAITPPRTDALGDFTNKSYRDMVRKAARCLQ